MHPILRRLVYLSLIFFLILAVIPPYNWICKMSGKCSGIVFENFLPSTEGNKEITAFMEVMNYRQDIEFEVVDPKMLHTVSGRKNSVIYHVKNLAGHAVKFRPEFSVEPKEMAKYISRDECLCFREYSMKKGEEIELPATFTFKSKIDKDFAGKDITVRMIYTAKVE